ncbi:MAG TPA: carboxypeptidase-like regulatory domain-containing protein [Candidatus Ozemobacteraceae bacterium]|nr:carboxypeptidase-like regulatory domain-containing protein [Candidatus Ozemobacteraceae bacterium]
MPSLLRRFAGFCLVGITALIAGGWCVPVDGPPVDVLTRRDVALHLGRALPAGAAAVSLPTGSDVGIESQISSVLAAGAMGLYPDGRFRPAEPMRVGEVLTVWARVWKRVSRGAGIAGCAGVNRPGVAAAWRWGGEELSLLARVDATAAAGVAALSPDEYATPGFWRFLPMPDAGCSAVSSGAQNGTPDRAVMPGRVVDAVTGKPIRGAVGTIDGLPFSTDERGEFPVGMSENTGVRDVFVAVDGYRSLSLRWNPAVRSELKLSLRPFRAPLEVRVTTADGKPVTGAHITLEQAGGAVTGGDGVARMRGLKPGYYRLHAALADARPVSQLISVSEEGTRHTIRLPAS